MNTLTEVKIWDPAVRIFHWTLVVAFAVAYLTEDELLNVHVLAGYTVAGLVLFRLLWGFIGSRYARFSDFVYPPRVVKDYTKNVLRGRAERYLGHNPAGGAMIIVMLIALAATTVTGLAVYAADQQAGPLAALLGGVGKSWEQAFEETHEFFANVTAFLVILHVSGVIVESLLNRENLVRAMFTGRKRRGGKGKSDASLPHPVN